MQHSTESSLPCRGLKCIRAYQHTTLVEFLPAMSVNQYGAKGNAESARLNGVFYEQWYPKTDASAQSNLPCAKLNCFGAR